MSNFEKIVEYLAKKENHSAAFANDRSVKLDLDTSIIPDDGTTSKRHRILIEIHEVKLDADNETLLFPDVNDRRIIVVEEKKNVLHVTDTFIGDFGIDDETGLPLEDEVELHLKKKSSENCASILLHVAMEICELEEKNK